MSQTFDQTPPKSKEIASAEPGPLNWAILVGVNYYNRKAKDLFGCVRDIQAQREYLKSRAHYIAELTIDTPSESNSISPSPHSQYPTLQNVTDSIRHVAAGAQEGDHVYIHFAGHGTQIIDKNTSSEKGFGDLAWVLYDEVTGISYLYEKQIVSIVSEMASNGCFVTMVLDCCFSGGVGRHDRRHGIRTTPYDPAIGSIYPPTSVLVSGNEPNNVKRGATRLAVPGSFLDPGTYTILTACGPDEVSDEIVFSDKTRSGALSHFLLRTLKAHNGETLSIRSLYNHLRLKFEVLHPQQSPMCYGLKNVTFLGRLASPSPGVSATVFKNPKDGVLYMDRGIAHGVSMGDEYALKPMGMGANTDSGSAPSSSSTCVSKVYANMSELVRSGDWSKSKSSESRWEATPLSLSCRKLAVDISIADEDVKPFIVRLSTKHFVEAMTHLAESSASALSVTLGEHGDYSIVDRAGKFLVELPLIPRTDSTAVEDVADIIGQCARFSYIRSMENLTPDAQFEQAFTVHIECPGSANILSGEMITVTEDQKLALVVQNFGDKPLYVGILVLQPTRQISLLPSKSKVGLIAETDSETVTAPRPKNEYGPAHTGILKRSFRMTVPEELRAEGWEACQDTFKVIITSRSTSFACLSMPRVARSTKRSPLPFSSHLNHYDIMSCLSGNESPSRGPSNAGEGSFWTTRTFTVRVSR